MRETAAEAVAKDKTGSEREEGRDVEGGRVGSEVTAKNDKQTVSHQKETQDGREGSGDKEAEQRRSHRETQRGSTGRLQLWVTYTLRQCLSWHARFTLCLVGP